MDRKTENQLRQEIAEVWALLDAERAGQAALIRRIEQEEQAKTMECGCIGCTNRATHTWSGHPTCDDCGTPRRKQTELRVSNNSAGWVGCHDDSVRVPAAELARLRENAAEADDLRKDAELGECIREKFRLMKGSAAVRFLGCLGVNEPEGGFDWSKTVLELIDAAIAQEHQT